MKKAIIMTILAVTVLFRPTLDYGVVLNNQGDGMIYGADPQYNYIHYDKGCSGDSVYTLCLYNPRYCYLGAENDDIILRYDLVRR